MDKHFILSVLSDDRPGVIRHIAELVAKQQGNWLESRLTQLAGKFAGVIRISLAEGKIDDLQASLQGLAERGIKVVIDELQTVAPAERGRTATFSAVGPDRPGIVLEITQALTQYNINIADLNTNCSSMPYSGEPLFEAEGLLHVPASTDLEQLAGQLDTIADALGIDISLEEGALAG
jgi:glycine cleavage system regulatory protein